MTSVRFEELEKRCARLKKIRILRIVVTIGFLFLGGFGGYYWIHQSNIEPVVVSVPPTEKPAVVVPIPSLSDHNESNATLFETMVPEVSRDETLFLAPHVYKDEAKLPVSETEEATRSLHEEQQLLKAYNTVSTFDNAYALAHFYFEHKAYAEVIMWAKEASKHNSSSEKPWILYAKAKFYLGDRTEAIRSLELFLGYINSKEAHELLNFYKGQE
ncbi:MULTISPECIES: CDC27 family protein [unclassified Sulfurospirillum]|uniref:CDC27 family protein n=1 Tax=unclassified Sulfurospirillum TaxID=2618290 RepID=UPI0004FFA484|nr:MULTISPECIES: CDC27 family protein [unclassified Sulfurospirillum]KFL35166.1 hypothetical protein JU57_02395 [Sulfurospirillum sp. SCADC]